MSESEYDELRAASWRRRLSPAEEVRVQTYLAAHPQAQADWELEAGLNCRIAQLPDAPVPSNFTARVLQALDRQPAPVTLNPTPLARLWQWFRLPAPRIAWALLLATAAGFAYHHHRANARNEMAKALSVLAQVTALSDPAVLQDFEAIECLGRAAPSDDDELFAVLNQ